MIYNQDSTLHYHLRALAGVVRSKDDPVPYASKSEVEALEVIPGLDDGTQPFLSPHASNLLSNEAVQDIWPGGDDSELRTTMVKNCRKRARQYGLRRIALSPGNSANDHRYNRRVRAYIVDTFLCGVHLHEFSELEGLDQSAPSASRISKLFDDHMKYHLQLNYHTQKKTDYAEVARQKDRRKRRRQEVCQMLV